MTSAAKETPTTSGKGGHQKIGRSKRGETTQKGGTGVAGGYHAGNGVLHTQKQRNVVETPFKTDGVGKMVELNVKGG